MIESNLLSRWTALLGGSALCAAFLVAPESAGQDIKVGTGTATSRSTYETRGKDFKHIETSLDYPEESHNPDAEEQKRLRVRWDEVRMGYYDHGPTASQWHDSDALTPYRELAVKGRLLIASADGKSMTSVNWLQGIRVILARSPRTKLDWSKRQDVSDSVWNDCTVKDDGRFFVTLDPA